MKENHLFEEIVEHSVDEIFVIDRNGIVLYVNEACETNYGVQADRLIGASIKNLEDDLFTPSATLEVLKRQRPVEIMQRTTRGKRLFVKSRPVFDKETGELTKVISYARDLSDLNELRERVQKLEKQLEDQSKTQGAVFGDIIAESDEIQQVLKASSRIALTDVPVLLSGETGVGKTLLAKKIHSLSKYSDGVFQEINCAELPKQNRQIELFKYLEGGEGLVELPDRCTLLFDEISEMPLHFQANLLKTLENSDKSVRFIFSTSHNLEEKVQNGEFRGDLYYRLNILPVYIPPLRNRKNDIYPLANHFLQTFNEEYNQHKTFSPIALNALYEYEWRGNIREMENLIQRLVIMSETTEITIDQLPSIIKAGSISHAETLPEKLEQMERYLITEAYDLYGSSYKVADSLGISQSSAMRKIKKYMKS
ncbi:sigma-54 interaction domain-containing protein [Halobacillus salinus]|nr:sigma 54-interacting transcriptional regulator [Halobacillus salinus]